MVENDTVTVTEAARMLGTTDERVVRLIKRGILTSRMGVVDRRRRLIPREEVDEYLAKHWKP